MFRISGSDLGSGQAGKALIHPFSQDFFADYVNLRKGTLNRYRLAGGKFLGQLTLNKKSYSTIMEENG